MLVPTAYLRYVMSAADTAVLLRLQVVLGAATGLPPSVLATADAASTAYAVFIHS